jgi:flagellar basal body-associated protein FliL
VADQKASTESKDKSGGTTATPITPSAPPPSVAGPAVASATAGPVVIPVPTPASAAGASAVPGAAVKHVKGLVGGAGKQAKAVFQNLLKKKDRRSLIRDLPQAFSSVLSPDPPTRKMAVLFILSFIGLVSVGSVLMQRYWAEKKVTLVKEAQRVAKRIAEHIKKDSEQIKLRASVISLGSFTWEIKETVSAKRSPGSISSAEVEIVLQCDSIDTRDYIQENMVKVRDQLSNIFTSVDRAELMTREGKRKIKRTAIRRLNEWMSHGKIEDLYISKLIMG